MRFLIILVFLITPTFAAAAGDMAFSARYDFYWKGFRVFSSNVSAEIKDDTYHTSADLYPRGMATWFVSGRSDISARGQISDQGDITAREWKVDGKWDGDTTHRHITFAPDGRVESMKVTIPEKWEPYPLKPIPDDLKYGPDPMSVMVALLRSPWDKLQAGGPVTLTMIDGQYVIEYTMTPVGEDKLEKQGKRSPYVGQAFKTTVSYKQLAGFTDVDKLTDKQRKKYDKARKKYEKRKAKLEKQRKAGKEVKKDEIIIWFQYFKELNAYLPVRAKLSGREGNASVYLADYAAIIPES